MTPEPFPGTFPGTVGAPPDVRELTSASELVCVGEVVGTSEEGVARYRIGEDDYDFERVVARLRVEETLIGEAPGGTVEVAWLRFDMPSALARLDQGERAVLFLSRAGERYRLTDPGTGKQPVTEELLAELRQ